MSSFRSTCARSAARPSRPTSPVPKAAAGAASPPPAALPLDLRACVGSALTADIPVPKGGVGDDVPITYVPARNTIFLSLALGWAEAAGASDTCIGVNAIDYSGYPDCRPDFVAAFERLAALATKAGAEGRGFRIVAPLL